jgi:hypothetical protein
MAGETPGGGEIGLGFWEGKIGPRILWPGGKGKVSCSGGRASGARATAPRLSQPEQRVLRR